MTITQQDPEQPNQPTPEEMAQLHSALWGTLPQPASLQNAPTASPEAPGRTYPNPEPATGKHAPMIAGTAPTQAAIDAEARIGPDDDL